ncbi:MAG TPA: hypothetical protein H9683_04380 [Firmicutes bacterium]|nr:hypothetical protein [Bacillota bacterium]
MSDKKFRYTYTAPTEEERREIESIRAAYRKDVRSEKLERLRRLNARVKNVAMSVALTLGVLGLLVFGLGMTMILEWGILAGGVAVSAAGVLPMAAAAPAYNFVLRRGKEKYGEEIVRLSEELLGDDDGR